MTRDAIRRHPWYAAEDANLFVYACPCTYRFILTGHSVCACVCVGGRAGMV